MSNKWEHKYKGFTVIKNGTKDYPWNIYRDTGIGFGTHVGYDKTFSKCKQSIDIGLFDELSRTSYFKTN